MQNQKIIVVMKKGGKIEVENPNGLIVDPGARCVSIIKEEDGQIIKRLIPFESIEYMQDVTQKSLVEVPGGGVINFAKGVKQ